MSRAMFRERFQTPEMREYYFALFRDAGSRLSDHQLLRDIDDFIEDICRIHEGRRARVRNGS